MAMQAKQAFAGKDGNLLHTCHVVSIAFNCHAVFQDDPTKSMGKFWTLPFTSSFSLQPQPPGPGFGPGFQINLSLCLCAMKRSKFETDFRKSTKWCYTHGFMLYDLYDQLGLPMYIYIHVLLCACVCIYIYICEYILRCLLWQIIDLLIATLRLGIRNQYFLVRHHARYSLIDKKCSITVYAFSPFDMFDDHPALHCSYFQLITVNMSAISIARRFPSCAVMRWDKRSMSQWLPTAYIVVYDVIKYRKYLPLAPDLFILTHNK